MPYVESFDGTKIYYEIKGEGVPLILLAGCGENLGYWKFQEPLASKYKLVMIDIAGIGKSGKSRDEYTFPSFGQDVKAVIENEQLDNVVILGYSIGGIVALEATLLLKEKVVGIISVESLLPETAYYGRKATENEIAEAMKDYEGNYEEYYDNLIRNMMGNRVEPELMEWVISVAGYKQNDPDILREMVRIMLPYDYHDVIEQISCPIKYLLRGLYSPEYLEIIKKEQKNAIVMENVGHLVNVEDPQTFNQIVDDFMQELTRNK